MTETEQSQENPDRHNLRHRETLTVLRDGEEIRVWNGLNVDMAYQVNGGNPVLEEFPGCHRIEIKGAGPEPDYVTSWVAEELRDELGIDLFGGHDEFDIEVIDVNDEEVTVL